MSSFTPMGTTFFGRIVSSIFSFFIRLRNIWYTLFPPKMHSFPTISIGGISAGGTGKTPLTDAIIKELYAKGYTPILFSRGYRRKSKETVIVRPYEKVIWQETGDEPAMLRRKNPFIWLAIDGNRNRAFKKIQPELPENAILLMDDGFQHRQFYRHVDIVTLPVTIFMDHLIPQGLMREPLQSLARATVIVIVQSPGEDNKATETYLKLKSLFPKKKIFRLSIETTEWHSLSGVQKSTFIEEEITILSGIARPERFIKAARVSCKNIHKIYTFPDHHEFSNTDFRNLSSIESPLIGTTEKDLIRLNTENFDNREKLWYLIAVVRFNTELQKQDFFEYIDKSMRQLR